MTTRPEQTSATPGTPPRPHLRELAFDEIRAILARNSIARMAFSYRGEVGITPVHYVLAEDWLYGRTSAGEKLEAIQHNKWVAVLVDEIDDLFDWRSVLVRGAFHVLSADGPPEIRKQWTTALEHVRTLVPETFTAADPAPERTTLFGITIRRVTGRESSLTR